MKQTRIGALAGGLLLAASMASAQDQGSKIPSLSKLNPFRKLSAAAADNPLDKGLPLPAAPKLPAAPRLGLPKLKTPDLKLTTAWRKLNNGSRNIFSKTRSMLTPWKSGAASPPPPSPTGVRSVQPAKARTARPPAKKRSFFSFLSGRAPEPEIRTVNDFLALPPVPIE